jgi:pSer/pThr/pTyr-binding forkhead associated (FHA) protein
MAKIIVKRKAELVKVFELDPARSHFTLGSNRDNDLVLADNSVATRHLKIECADGNYYLEKGQTEVEMIINGRPLMKRMQMVQGDEIAIGDLRLLFISHTTEPVPVGGDDMEVIDEHYLDKKFVSKPFAANSHDEVIIGSEPAVSEDLSDEASEGASDFYELEDFSDEATPSQPVAEPPTRPPGDVLKGHHLLAIYGPYMGKKFPLKATDTRIGRDNSLNDIVIRVNEKGALDPSISRRHATISCRDGRFVISDKRSKTRSYVNQVKLNPDDELPIEEGDEIEIVSDQKSTIFRFSSTAESDLAAPRKAGVWWIRNALRAGTLLYVLFGVAALGMLGFSCVNRMTANKKPAELKFVEEAWFQDKSPASSPAMDERSGLAVGDLNGDNKVDVIFTDRNHNLLALDGVTKKTIWINEQIGVQSNIPLVLADLNGNQMLDVLVVGRDSRLRGLDGVNGAEMWLSPILGEEISGAPVAADFNGDGLKDVVVCTKSGRIHFGTAYVNEMDWKSVESNVNLNAAPSAADCNGDGASEIYIGSEDGKLIICEGRAIVKTLDLREEMSKATGAPVSRFEIQAPPLAADLNGNNVLDLVIGSTDGAYLALEGGSYSRLWHEQLGDGGGSFGGSPAAGVFDGDKIEDVALTAGHLVKIIKGSADAQNRKQAAWQKDFGLANIAAPLAVTDFDRDGIHDVVVALSNGKIAVMSGFDGKPLAEIANAENPAISAPVIADAGNDGSIDILFVRKDNSVYRIQTNSTIDKNSVIWGQAYGNERNSGRYEFVRPQSMLIDVTLSVTTFLFLGVFTITSLAKKKRERVIKANQRT